MGLRIIGSGAIGALGAIPWRRDFLCAVRIEISRTNVHRATFLLCVSSVEEVGLRGIWSGAIGAIGAIPWRRGFLGAVRIEISRMNVHHAKFLLCVSRC